MKVRLGGIYLHSRDAHMTHTPSLAGRVALVTGANTGIGLVTARELARQGAHLFITCRTLERAQPALAHLRAASAGAQVEALALDLGDFASVRRCAQTFLARGLPLHLLVNNAGLAGSGGLTTSGFELAFGVNHMGHFLLTQLLLERIQASARGLSGAASIAGVAGTSVV